jgi:tetratricopeptide (TPR) repeat protein
VGGLVLGAMLHAANAARDQSSGPPSPDDVDSAAQARQQQILLSPAYPREEREARLAELEIARRILRDERRRSQYDALLLGFHQGLLGGGRLDSLRHLQDLARADMAEERGEPASNEEGAALLKQGIGYLDARLPREAVAPLRRAVAALPRSAAAHDAFVQALLRSDDPLALGGHALSEIQRSLDALAALGAAGEGHAALSALCRGLQARDQGDQPAAEAELRRATGLDGDLAPAWRGLAALALNRGAADEALGYCRRALAIDRRDERALLMAIGACLRAGQRSQAREVAAQLATVRGAGWTAEAVLRELAG